MTMLQGHNSSIQDMTLNNEQKHLVSLGTDKMVKVWDVRNYKCLQTIQDKIK